MMFCLYSLKKLQVHFDIEISFLRVIVLLLFCFPVIALGNLTSRIEVVLWWIECCKAYEGGRDFKFTQKWKLINYTPLMSAIFFFISGSEAMVAKSTGSI